MSPISILHPAPPMTYASIKGIKVPGQFRDTFTLVTLMRFSKHKRDPLADPYTLVGITRWRTRLFRDRSTAIPATTIEAIETQSITPPMDATPIHEEEVYEFNIAGIGSWMGPGVLQMQRVCIPPASPPASPTALSRTVTPRRETNQEPNIIPGEVSEVCTTNCDDRLLKTIIAGYWGRSHGDLCRAAERSSNRYKASETEYLCTKTHIQNGASSPRFCGGSTC